MRYALIILKWEIQKIMSSWKKTMAIFLVPAAVMVFAINLFPRLLNYLSTGTFGAQQVIVFDAPQSFIDYGGKKDDLYRYTYKPMEEFAFSGSADDYEERIYDLVDDGMIVLIFSCNDPASEFDIELDNAYRDYFENGNTQKSKDSMLVLYDDSNFLADSKASQFEYDVVQTYNSYLQDVYFDKYVGADNETFKVDEYNPITFILDNRSIANAQASHVIPGIMMILMYYCCYSLACDMIAMEKNRGFLNKLIMTPASAKAILWGKALATNLMVTASSLVTFLFLFLSSWINRSNDAGSLLPFGLLLMPDQLFYMILAIPATTLVLTAFCFLVSLELERFEDAVANMQFILLIFLLGFFIQMFYYFDPVWTEYLIPGHNFIVLLKQIICSEVNIIQFIVVLSVNSLLGVFLIDRCANKIVEKDVNSIGGQDDRSQKRQKKIFFR